MKGMGKLTECKKKIYTSKSKLTVFNIKEKWEESKEYCLLPKTKVAWEENIEEKINIVFVNKQQL